MKILHTQGEWTIEIQPMPHGTARTINVGSNRIATLEFMPTIEESEANAKLIAAAPILYNAAYSALQAIYAMPKSKQGFYQYLINDLLNAIQKANGTRI